MAAEIHPFMPRPVAEALIHRLAEEGRFILEPVFQQKMRDRDFSMRQVLETLKSGGVNQGPERDECGDMRCRVRKRVAGRLVRIVLASHGTETLYLISVH